jgi:CelD/BcsL family acetyltransferase involved in cellulose biosynthesis
MDLANAPDLTREGYAVAGETQQHGELRLIDAVGAASTGFVEEWQELANRASEPNPYLEPWFMLPSLAAFAPAQVHLAALYCGGALTGIIPLVRSGRYYGHPIPHVSTWSHANSFCGAPLVLPGHEARFWRALIAEVERGSGTALFLHLPMVPTDGPLYAALQSVLAEQRRPHAEVARESRALLRSDLSADDYLAASMSVKKRKELRRQHNRLAEEGVLTFERISDADALNHWINEFLTLEAAGWKGEASSALANAASTSSFFTAALTGAAREGRLERLALRLDGRPIAMLANFLCPPGAFSFKTAFDEDYARFSPGMLLQLENLALLDREGIDWADSCAAEGHPMIERLWRERRTLVATNIALGGPIRRAVFRGLMAYETRNRSAP